MVSVRCVNLTHAGANSLIRNVVPRLTFIAKVLLLSPTRADYTRWLCGHSVLRNCDSPAIRFGRAAVAHHRRRGYRFNPMAFDGTSYAASVIDIEVKYPMSTVTSVRPVSPNNFTARS